VYYVGPIRDIEYPADPISNPLYVGRRGEQSIEILQREADRSVVDPETGESVRFADALARALRRFELGEDVVVEERGRERAGLSVAGTNSETDEVNAVGVGVGQVLPVLMQCILGKPNASTVVIEQPELHLHPRLEQEMADFFIDCIQTGRRLIIETHSEHLINRLRLRIAEDDANELAPKIKILFAEKSPMGITHFREPTINKYGAIEEDWPEGFLDLSVKESSELLDKAVKRRRAELESRRQELDAKYGSRESEQK
jgi:predicted ATPase